MVYNLVKLIICLNQYQAFYVREFWIKGFSQMKKTFSAILSILLVCFTVNTVCAKVKATSPETAAAIKLYKAGNYTQSYVALKNILDKDSSNALASYYMGMTAAQIGKRDEALQYYGVAAELSPNGILGKYARKGKKCIETPSLCHEPDVLPSAEGDTLEDKFIKGKFGSGFSEQARGVHEKEKIQQLKRDINRNEDIAPSKFKEYKDFSSQMPTNDEIVQALRVLQRAGLQDVMGTNTNNDAISAFFGTQNNRNGNDVYDMLFSRNSANPGLSPQVIQSLLTTQMTTGF